MGHTAADTYCYRARGTRRKKSAGSKSSPSAHASSSSAEANAHAMGAKSRRADLSSVLSMASAAEIVASMGIGLLMGVLLICFGSDVLLVPASEHAFIRDGLIQLFGLATLAASIVFCWRFSDRISSLNQSHMNIIGSGILLLSFSFQCAKVVLAWDIGYLVIPLWMLIGAAFAFTFVPWTNYLWSVPTRCSAIRVILLSVTASAISIALIALVPTPLFRLMAIIIFTLLSSFGYAASRSSFQAQDYASREQSLQNIKFDIKTSVSLFVAAIAQGFSAHFMFASRLEGFAIVAAALFLAGVFIFVGMKAAGEEGVFLSSVLRWIHPLLIAGFVFMPFADGPIPYLCNLLVLTTCFMCLSSLVITLLDVKDRYTMQPVYAWSRVLMPWVAGTFGGWLIGFAKIFAAQSYGQAADFVAMLLIVILLGFSAAIAPYGIDALTLPTNSDDSDEDSDESLRARHAWSRACEQLAQECSLTPRECDVFRLLAKGRNARIIERELSISVHTIKGHNYNIYRKLEIKSQQELIDLVENRRKEIWEAETEIR